MTTKRNDIENTEASSAEPEKSSARTSPPRSAVEADTSLPDPHQWEKRDGLYEGDDDAPSVLEG